MERRRLEDRVPGYVLASIAEPRSASLTDNHPETRGSEGRSAEAWPRETSAPVILVEADGGQLLAVAGGELWRLARPPGVGLEDVAEAVAETVRHRQAANLQKQRFNEGFLVFVERLNRARSRSDVYDALLEQAPQLMGAYAAVLYVTGPPAASVAELHAVVDARVPVRLDPLPADDVLPRPVPVLITLADVAPGEPFTPFAPLFTQIHARQLTCITLGEQGLLVLIERRYGRDFTGEEWFRLQTVGHHAQRSLERIDLCDHGSRTVVAVMH
jgi:hypothetical protein